LQGLLITGLTSGEIVLGKYLAQVVRVLELAFAGWPLLGFFAVLGALEPERLLAIVVSPLLPLLAVAAASFLASVCCRSTNEAVLAVYGFGALLWLGLDWGFGAVDLIDPRYLLEPCLEASDLGEFGRRWQRTAPLWLSMTLACLGLSVWQLRPTYIRQLTARANRRRRAVGMRRPPVSDLPIRWKERYIEKTPLLRWLPHWTVLAGIVTLSLGIGVAILIAHLPATTGAWPVLRIICQGDRAALEQIVAASDPAGPAFRLLALLVVFVAGLAMAVRCSASVCGERERKTWESLLLTPLEAKQLVRGKLWGAMDGGRIYLLAFTMPMVLLAMLNGLEAMLWALFSYLAALAVMYFAAANGIRCSVAATSSWRSLLQTVLTTAQMIPRTVLLFGLVGVTVAGMFLGVVGLVVWVTAIITQNRFVMRALTRSHSVSFAIEILFLGACVTILLALLAEAERHLQAAEAQVMREERVCQGDDPNPYVRRVIEPKPPEKDWVGFLTGVNTRSH